MQPSDAVVKGSWPTRTSPTHARLESARSTSSRSAAPITAGVDRTARQHPEQLADDGLARLAAPAPAHIRRTAATALQRHISRRSTSTARWPPSLDSPANRAAAALLRPWDTKPSTGPYRCEAAFQSGWCRRASGSTRTSRGASRARRCDRSRDRLPALPVRRCRGARRARNAHARRGERRGPDMRLPGRPAHCRRPRSNSRPRHSRPSARSSSKPRDSGAEAPACRPSGRLRGGRAHARSGRRLSLKGAGDGSAG
jgi:hypothetical protein